MRVSMLTCGTRGDTQPLVVLGSELRRRGHEVVVAASPNTLDLPRAVWVRGAAVRPGQPGSSWSPSRVSAGSPRATSPRFTKELHARSPTQTFDRSVEEAERGRAPGRTSSSAGVLAEDLSVPDGPARGRRGGDRAQRARAAHVGLPAPARDDGTRCPAGPTPLTGRRLRHRVVAGQQAGHQRLPVGGRARLRGRPVAALARGGRPARAADVRRRARAPTAAGTPRRPLTGFLTPGAEIREARGEAGLSADLAVLAARPAIRPCSFGFGSMPVQDPAATVSLIADVSRALGVRALRHAPAGAAWPRSTPDDPAVKVVGPVDHDAVMPRCVAAVHHGGAGTTAASVGAGIPTVVCSVFADQPFWGARVEDAGAGAAPAVPRPRPRPAREGRPCRSRPGGPRACRGARRRLVTPEQAVRAAADAVEARVG